MKLREGLGEQILLKRIGFFNRTRSVGERGLGFYLLDFERRGLRRKYGFSKTSQFAQMRHHLEPRKTRELLRIARALEELPQIDDVFSEGKISWSAVLEISRVATKETGRRNHESENGADSENLQKAVGNGMKVEKAIEDGNMAAQRFSGGNGSQTDVGHGGFTGHRLMEKPFLVDLRGSRSPGHSHENPTHVGHDRKKAKVPRELRDKPNTPALRQQVLGRDGMQFRAPGCTNRAELICHLEFRNGRMCLRKRRDQND